MLIEILKLVIGPVTGAALALFVNRLFEIRNKKPNLFFGIRYDCDIASDSIDIKTNPSGFLLYCVNSGHEPLYIRQIVFYKNNYKKKFLVISPSPDNELSPIMPLSSVSFSLDNQEYNNLLSYLKTNRKNESNYIAYTFDNKKIKGVVDFVWLKSKFMENSVNKK